MREWKRSLTSCGSWGCGTELARNLSAVTYFRMALNLLADVTNDNNQIRICLYIVFSCRVTPVRSTTACTTHHQRNSQLLSADTFCGPSYLCYRPRYVTIVCMYARIAWVNFYTNSITIPAFVTLKLTDQAYEEGGGLTCVSRRAKNMWRICNYLLARKVAGIARCVFWRNCS